MMSWNGNNFFAPESVLTKDGRRVMWAWLIDLPVAHCGVQSLPRELELPDDGVLRIRPLRELQSLRYDEKQEEGDHGEERYGAQAQGNPRRRA